MSQYNEFKKEYDILFEKLITEDDVNKYVDAMMYYVKKIYNDKYSKSHVLLSDEQLLPLIVSKVARLYIGSGVFNIKNGNIDDYFEEYSEELFYRKDILTPNQGFESVPLPCYTRYKIKFNR